MDLSLERDSSVLGSLFNQIITDMKNTSPLWEDFIGKAGKLHACLRATIQAIAAYLDAFQKIADAATNSRGATKEIGTALTRVCLRHKAVETRLKTFTTAIMDCLVLPLQDKLEDWKRSVATIDKEHAKEHKRCRAELKKRSSDTLRLQKKARKGQSETIQSLVDSHLQDVTQRRAELEDVEKRSLRSAMIEERLRYCSFVHMLQPVVKEECEVISELGHLQEAMQSIALVTKEPSVLPPASEDLILDVKSAMCLYSESPCGSGSQGGCSNSLGSRKSSVCSISSLNSSGSSGSPGHHQYQRSLSQFVSPAIRLKAGESSDSGFCSSPALTTQVSAASSQTHAVSTWPPHSQDGVATPTADRPHTISTAYEKGHQRPPLTVYTFQNPETIMESCGTNVGSEQSPPSAQKQSGAGGAMSRPPLPVRCSSLERPLSANSNRNGVAALAQRQCPSPLPAHITKELSTHHAQQQLQMQSAPTYVNMSELASMATMKIAKQQHHQHQQQPVLQQQQSTDSHSSISSNISNDSVSNSHQNHNNSATMTANTNTSRNHSNHSHSTASSSSLHSHPSIDSAVATSFVAQTPTPSSGCSTPQNHYSPLLTNSPSSTAAGTPSGGSVGHGASVFNVSSPTTEQSATGNCTPSSTAQGSVAADLLEITQTDSSKNISVSCNEASTNNTNQSSSSINNTDSSTIIENDERSRASVLQKASMFEKQAAAISKGSPSPSPAAVARNNNAIEIMGGSNHGLRRIDDYRVPTPVQQQTEYAAHDKDVDRSFEDSIQELNNLIGELDSFQREIDDSKSHRGSTSSELSEEQHGTNTTTTTTATTLKAVLTTAATLSQAATTLHTYQQEHQRQSTQKHTETRAVNSCASSNQTNSSGCGADISDATSDKVDAFTVDNNSIGGVNCIKGSGSEMGSHCYMSESNSLIDSDGYENPTFAHFAGSHSMLTTDDGMSQVSETYTFSSHEQQAFLNTDDGSSAVVVIYDHQIPITPDIDYVKKNSEIVVLRTKDPQQLHYHQQHEMRELQHLPTNLSALTDGDGLRHDAHVITATATVAPANQRLSSFRASTEQQLQILTGCNSIIQKQQQQKGTHRLSTDSKNSLKLSAATATLPSAHETLTLANGFMRRKLPPKPNLSVFNSSNGKIEASNSKNNFLPQHRPQQLPVAIKADFKADLNAKIRKQKEKCLQKEHHEQQQQQQQQHNPQQQLPQSLPITNNCNTNKYRSALLLPLPTTTAPSVTSSTSPPANDSIFSVSPSSLSSLTITSSNNSLSSTLSQPEHSHFNHNNLQNHFHSPLAATQAATTSPIPALSLSVAVTALNFPYACASGAVPTASHSSSSSTATVSALLVPSSASSSSFSSTVTCAASASLAKPNISPRPASLSGGNTHIARRSSINTNKPSPPVRRSSSVTPSQNSNSGKRPGDASVAATSNLLYPKHNALNKSVENLPPPPAFLLVEQSPAQCNVMPTSPSHPANVIPLSALKVAETVKALRYQQPLSPVGLRSALVTNSNQQQLHCHQQQANTPKIQQLRNTYDSSLVSRNSASPSTLNSDKYYKCNVDGNQAHITSSPHTPPAAATHQSSSVSLPSSPSPPPPSIAQVQATGPPPLPPQNPNRHLHNRNRHHQQNQAQQHSLYSNSCQSNNVPGDQSSFRTSSPGIYAQPKLVSTMSSFRTSSPSSSSNGGHQQHPVQVPLPPTQPKANPNLIAQLNARINKQQQGIVSDQTSGGSSLTSTNHQQSNETVYIRNCGSQQQHHHHQQQQLVQEAQQQNYDDHVTSTNLDKANVVVGCSSMRSKTKAEFLENLNANLAKQGISGRAFAVRNLINSKALPDPRLCHESLMDQIKRGATLKRNQKINDRSAPKIH